MGIPYLVNSLPVGKTIKRTLAGDFTVLWAEEDGSKMTVQTCIGSRELTKKQGAEEWTGHGFTVTARRKNDVSPKMIIGRITKGGGDNTTDAFVAIELCTDEFKSILINDNPTGYQAYFQDSTNDGTLSVSKTPNEESLTFVLPSADQAKTALGQSPGRFDASKIATGKTDITGFVLPNRIKVNNEYRRVLVGHTTKSSVLPSSDDIEPFVAIAANSGKGAYDVG